MSKFTLTVFDANGTTVASTKEYSRKIDAERAGQKSGSAWTVANPKGDLVSEGAPPAAKAAKPAQAAAKGKAAPKQRAGVKFGTFAITGDADQKHKCVGACGEKKAVKAFPTITGNPSVRVAECRVCRDTRTKAEKAAKAAAK